MGGLCHELRLWKRISSKSVLLCLAILIISILVDNNNVLCQEKKTKKTITKSSKMDQIGKYKPIKYTSTGIIYDDLFAPYAKDENMMDNSFTNHLIYPNVIIDNHEDYKEYIKKQYMTCGSSSLIFEEVDDLNSPFLRKNDSNIYMTQWAANNPIEDRCYVSVIDLNEIELKPLKGTYTPKKSLQALFIKDFDELATNKMDNFIKFYKEHVETNKVMTPLPSHYTLDDDIDIFYDDNMHEPLSSHKSSSSIDAGKDAEDIYGLKDNQFIFSSVMDGHGGSTIADLLKRWLPVYVKKNLMEKIINGKLKPRDIISSIENAHVELDQDLLELNLDFNEERINYNASGSCALSVLMDKHSYYVSNVGDSRSILLRSDSFVVLNNTHNISEAEEKEKLIKEHPEDKKLILAKVTKNTVFPEVNQAIMPNSERCGPLGLFRPVRKQPTYIKGLLQCTRSFGDFFLKDKRFATKYIKKGSNFQEPFTFPYITSRPEVHAIRRTKADRYLVLVSDGVSNDLNDFNIYEIVNNFGFSIQEAAKILIGASIENHSSYAAFDRIMLASIEPNKRMYHDDSTVVILKLF
ncbi:protein phosphatase PPM8 [Plasmodium berghei]|uniref:Protein phosphatase PPM8 n=2 Tax=Plasmodium berghei TaxID=5821 RepID=A0A509ALJ7_PLABA|nr:protein phosphatase PPM8 [Plasmodium berghei ANKA]CXI41595.1 protein phosphatase PPM8 [Plasmodium berghei]SCM21942.1 protein phosphatase PPM8 [Plasmodium berghei]SCN25180.1 protein phosphatase PPM8 [Plasmodium berghei]SCO60181.1 protein phosphatase PPM8 [Plasmodium berghei]SCO61778.1 protein phosphatase PPM8 [Plasmodium berghei]|eukprot:XP_034421485.1 protein phosphatase PPM8 [Plasmodium berghei ANKA]